MPASRRWPRVLAALAVAVVVLGAIGVLALDRILLSQARKQADALSHDLGRPVTIGGVATKLWGGLGVRVSDVAVGAAPGEDLPLAELRRAEVEADLFRAIRSLGKEIHVRGAVVEGLRLNVVKLPDGTTNVERASQALAKARPAEAAPPSGPGAPVPEQRSEPALRALEVDRAAVENARIAFLDRTVPGAKELAVDDLDAEIRDLATGKPVAVVVRAAVLAPRQNLELRVKAAPLPPSLEVVPEEVTLKVEPIVLDALAPFVPKDVGFRGGRFEADLAMKLGAAVPGGAGATTVKGGFKATRLVFAGQEGGKALDASLDADLQADAEKGDLSIGRLELAVGPMGLSGKGRASGLRGDAPRFDGLELVGRNLDPEALVPYYPPLRKMLGGAVVAGPVGLSIRGSGTQAAQVADVRVDLTPVRLAVPDQLAKAAGAPLVVTARASAEGGGRVRFDANADLAGVDLRPGGALAKKPGDPLSVKAAGTYRAQGDVQDVRLDRLEVALLADRLQGTANVQLAGKAPRTTTKFEAEARGERLDLDRLLLPAPPAPKGASAPGPGGGGAAPAKKPLDPAAFAGLSGTAKLQLGALRMKGVDARDVLVRIRVDGDEVRFEEARLQAFGGNVSATGTHLALARPDAPFEVALNLQGVEGKDFLKLVSDHEVLTGKLDAALKLGGPGWSTGLLAKSVAGAVDGKLHDGQFLAKDLVGSVAGPIAEKLPFSATKLADKGATALGKELPFGLAIKNGIAALTKPLRAETGQGSLSVEGGVDLDGTLQMPATLALSPELVSKITAGRAKPTAPIPVAFRIAGPAWKPRVEGLDVGAVVKTIADLAAAGAVGKALGVEGATSVEDVAAKKKAEAEARAREEADAQRKRLEEEAKSRLRGLFGK